MKSSLLFFEIYIEGWNMVGYLAVPKYLTALPMNIIGSLVVFGRPNVPVDVFRHVSQAVIAHQKAAVTLPAALMLSLNDDDTGKEVLADYRQGFPIGLRYCRNAQLRLPTEETIEMPLLFHGPEIGKDTVFIGNGIVFPAKIETAEPADLPEKRTDPYPDFSRVYGFLISGNNILKKMSFLGIPDGISSRLSDRVNGQIIKEALINRCSSVRILPDTNDLPEEKFVAALEHRRHPVSRVRGFEGEVPSSIFPKQIPWTWLAAELVINIGSGTSQVVESRTVYQKHDLCPPIREQEEWKNLLRNCGNIRSRLDLQQTDRNILSELGRSSHAILRDLAGYFSEYTWELFLVNGLAETGSGHCCVIGDFRVMFVNEGSFWGGSDDHYSTGDEKVITVHEMGHARYPFWGHGIVKYLEQLYAQENYTQLKGQRGCIYLTDAMQQRETISPELLNYILQYESIKP